MPTSAPSQHQTCPACNRFIGANLACPYCGLDSPHRPVQRILQLSAFTLSIGGLAILLLIGQRAPPPMIPIAQLRPVMNHGTITLTGTVVTEPRIYGTPQAPQSLSFELADTGGQLTVIALQETARNILAQGRRPAAGHAVQVTGHLYLAAGKPTRLYLDSSQSLYQGLAIP